MRDGQTSMGTFNSLGIRRKVLVTPRVMGEEGGIVLRCEVQTAREDAGTTETIVGATFVTNDQFRLARVADDEVSSETLLIFLRGKRVK